MIYIRTPLRVSLFGGGTDLRSFYSKHESNIIAFSINKYVHTFIKYNENNFHKKFRLNYSITEDVDDINKIKNDIIRETFKYFYINKNLFISTISDCPHGNGLGSSSSFTAGLVNGILKMNNIKKSNEELINIVCDIEINKVKAPIGIQDQNIVMSKNLVHLQINKHGETKIKKLNNKDMIYDIESKSLLVLFARESVDRSKILHNQIKRNINGSNLLSLKKLSNLTLDFLNILYKHEYKYELFCDYLNQSWYLKQKISDQITNAELNNQIQKLLSNNVKALKLLGAGGKGFIFCLFDSKKNRDNFYKKNQEISSHIKINTSPIITKFI